jgi:hypothetical protein
MTYVIGEPCVDVLDRACVEGGPVDCAWLRVAGLASVLAALGMFALRVATVLAARPVRRPHRTLNFYYYS